MLESASNWWNPRIPYRVMTFSHLWPTFELPTCKILFLFFKASFWHIVHKTWRHMLVSGGACRLVSGRGNTWVLFQTLLTPETSKQGNFRVFPQLLIINDYSDFSYRRYLSQGLQRANKGSTILWHIIEWFLSLIILYVVSITVLWLLVYHAMTFTSKIQNVLHTIVIVIYESNYGIVIHILYLLIKYVCSVCIVLSVARTSFTCIVTFTLNAL